MAEIFHYKFLVIAFTGALLAAASTALLSVFISLKKISFMGEALAHVSFAGIALALLIGANLSLMTLVIVILVALVIGFISRRNRISEANSTTIFLSVSMASAIIMLRINQDYTIDLTGYLFGNILLLNLNDLNSLGGLLLANLLFLLLFFKELYYMTYNYDMARVFKIPVRLLYYLFLIFLAVNIVITVKIVGIVLITAQLILPGITALNFTHKIGPAIWMSVLLAEIAACAGFFLSYLLDIPSGATIVLILFLLFLASQLYHSLTERNQKSAVINK